MTESRTTYFFLLSLAVAVAYGCYLLLAPFLKPILFAAVVAILFYPMYSKIRHRLNNRNVASLLTTLLVALLLLSSLGLLVRALGVGVHEIYDSLNADADGRERLGAYLLALSERAGSAVARYLPISLDLRQTVGDQMQRAAALVLASAASFFKGIASGLVNGLIGAFVLFFFFRDGHGMVRRICVLSPLRVDQTRRLFFEVRETLRAIVYGTLAIALLQGALTGIGFWFLDVTSPVLWATVTALCALVPVVGTGFVLLPAILMLFFNGHWIKALLLLGWGLAIVHPVDNVLRPYLIGGRMRLSTLFVFFSLVGGLRAFGAVGVFVGPVLLAAAFAVFRFFREESRRATRTIEISPHTAG